jgi:hypothetical protein
MLVISLKKEAQAAQADPFMKILLKKQQQQEERQARAAVSETGRQIEGLKNRAEGDGEPLAQLAAMGFPGSEAVDALMQCGGDVVETVTLLTEQQNNIGKEAKDMLNHWMFAPEHVNFPYPSREVRACMRESHPILVCFFCIRVLDFLIGIVACAKGKSSYCDVLVVFVISNPSLIF